MIYILESGLMKFASSVLARRLGGATLLGWAVLPNLTHAATITYANPAGAQNFTVGANWIGGAAPGSGDFPIINGANGAVDYPFVDSAVGVQRFNIADPSASSGGLEIRSGGTLTTSLTSAHYVGARGVGELRILPGGTASINGPVNVGWGDAVGRGTGTITQTGGAYIGSSASAALNIGAVAASGILPASVGTYNLQGGTMNIGGSVLVGQNGIGTFNVSAGSSMTATGSLVVGQAGTGIFNMNGGSITTNSFLQIGRTGAGTLTQTAGTLSANRTSGDAMVIAALAGATGKYEISGGSLSVTSTGAAGVTNGISAGTANATFKIVGTGASSISIAGDYKQYAGAGLELAIGAGITPIMLTGNATLGGTLGVAFSTTPSPGQQFTVMNYGGTLTGTFSTFDSVVDSPLGPDTIGLSISYGSGSNSAVVLTVVPEPTAGVMMATVVWCGAMIRRRTTFHA